MSFGRTSRLFSRSSRYHYLAAAAVVAATQLAHADNFSWTGVDPSSPTLWDLSSTNWDNTTLPATTVNWSNSVDRTASNTATFSQATVMPVVVNDHIDVGSITFVTSGWTIGAGAGDLAYGATGTLTVNSIGTNTIAAAIVDGPGAGGGVTSLLLSGNGTLILGGTNTYSGTTTLSAGWLSVSNDNQLGTGSGAGNISMNGAALMANSSFTLNANRGISIGGAGGGSNGQLAAAAGQTLTFNGVIANASSGGQLLIGTGTGNTGTVALGGNNTYSGGTSLNGGTLNFSTLAALGSGNITFKGGILQWAAGNAADASGLIANSVSTNAAILDVNNNAVVFNTALGSGLSGGLTVNSSTAGGSLTLSGANLYTGTTTVNGGATLKLASGASLLSGGSLTTSGGTSPGTFDVNGNAQVLGSVTNNGIVTNTGAATTLTLGAGSTGNSSSSFTGAMSIIWNQGAANSTINGTFTNTGNLTLNATAGGKATLAGTVNNAGSITGTGTVTISGPIGSNVTNVLATGSGVLTLSNTTNAWTGTTSATNGGTLAISNDKNLPAATTQISVDGGTFAGTTSSFTLGVSRSILLSAASGSALGTIGGFTMTIPGAVTVAPGGALNVTSTAGGTVSITGNNALTVAGGINVLSGTLSIGNTSTSSGFTGNTGITASSAYIAPGATLTVANPSNGANPENVLGSVTSINNAGTLASGGSMTLAATRSITLGTSTAGSGGAFVGNGTFTIAGKISDQSSDNYLENSAGQKTLQLINSTNSYSGGTHIWQPAAAYNGFTMIQVDSDGVNAGDGSELGTVPNAALPDGAGNRLSNNISLRGAGTLLALATMTLNANRGITLGVGGTGLLGNASSITGGQIFVSNNKVLTYAGVISDENASQPGTLTLGGSGTSQYGGTIVLGGASTYTGGTSVGEGAVLFSAQDAVNAGGPSVLGQLLVNGVSNVIQLNAAGGQYYSAMLGVDASGPTNFTLNANRSIQLAANVNGYDGFQAAQNHTFTYNGVISGGASGATGTILQFGDKGAVNLGGNNSLSLKQINAAGGGNYTISGNLNLTVIAGTQALPTVTVSGAGSTLSLTGTNTYSSTPTFNATGNGVFSITSDAALGAAPAAPMTQIYLGNNNGGGSSGVLQANGTFALNANRGIGIGGTLQSNSNSNGTFDVTAGNTLTINGVIQGLGAASPGLIKQNTGTLVLAGANTYSGPTTINGGTLVLKNSNALPYGAVISSSSASGTTVAAGGTLDISGQTLTSAITLNGGTLTNSSSSTGTITNGVAGIGFASSTSNFWSGSAPTLTISGSGSNATAVATLGLATAGIPVGNIGGGAGYTKAPVVIVTDAGGTGTGATATATISGGKVTGITINTAGYGYTSPVISFDNTGTAGSGATAAYDTTKFVLGSTQMTAPGSGFTAAPTITATGSGTATFTPVLSSIVLTGTSNSMGGSGGNIQINGIISSTGGFTKIGSNTVTLTAANTYTGGTTINGGTLVAANTTGSATGSAASTVTINSGGTLASGATGGTISGAVTATSGGHLSPGNSAVGTLTLTKGLALNSGAQLDYDFGTMLTNHTFVAGSSDLITVTNSVANPLAFTSGGTVTLNLASGASNFNGTGSYELLSYTSTAANTMTNFSPSAIVLGTGWGSVNFTSYSIVNDSTAKGIFLNFTATTATTSADATWTAMAGSGNWSDSANWTPGGPNNAAGSKLTFGTGSLAAVNVDAAKTAGTLAFTGATGYTLTGNSITMDNTGSGNAAITATGGASHIINSALSLTSSTDINVDTGTKLTLAGAVTGAGNLSLNGSGALIVSAVNNYGSTTLNGGTLGGSGSIAGAVTLNSGARIHPSTGLPATSATTLTVGTLSTNTGGTLQFNLITPGHSSVSDMISAATLNLNGGTLDFTNHTTGATGLGYYRIMQYNSITGAGLSSLTLPATANGIRYFLTTSQDPGYVDVHRGYMGDANDSGFVDLTDLTTLAGNWQQSGGWAQGDFDGSGFIDLTDLTILAGNWQTGIGAFGQAAESIEPNNASWQAAVQSVVFGASVPEPTSLALLGLGAAGLVARRRRK